jgi:hypothetical protein
MKKNHGPRHQQSHREQRLMEKLRRHPELLERFEAILGLSECGEGALRSADEIEELLVEEVRRLGSRVMHDWAQDTEERAAARMRVEHPQARIKKKAS